jgi:hypothetical protein
MIDYWLFNDSINFRHYFNKELDEEMLMYSNYVKGCSILNSLRLGAIFTISYWLSRCKIIHKGNLLKFTVSLLKILLN